MSEPEQQLFRWVLMVEDLDVSLCLFFALLSFFRSLALFPASSPKPNQIPNPSPKVNSLSFSPLVHMEERAVAAILGAELWASLLDKVRL